MGRKKSRADGRLQKSFTMNGKRYYVYGHTQKELNENLEKKKAEIKEKAYIKEVALTMDNYFERWIQNREGTVKAATIRNQTMWYKTAANTAIDKAGTRLGSLKLSEIEKQNIVDLQTALKGLYNTNTVNSYINLIKHILSSAVEDEIIRKNVAKSVKALKRTEAKARDTIHRALTEEETKAFFKAAADSWYLNHFRFMIHSGCRCGEVGALRYADINTTENKVEIRRTITKNEAGVYVVGDSTKTADGIRDIPLTEGIKQAISNQKEMTKHLGLLPLPSGQIFKSPENSLLDVTCVNREIKRICKAAGIEPFTAHAFRDTFATRAIESGMNPKTLQEILGHADISITMNLYCHVMEDTKIKQMNNISIAI